MSEFRREANQTAYDLDGDNCAMQLRRRVQTR